jgi:hypothetical protein
MTQEEISRMSAAELDALIAMAAKERTKRPDPHPAQAPKQFDATFNPAWSVFLADGNTIVQFKHLGHGWISIAIPPPERAHLLSLFLHHSLIAASAALPGATPSLVPVPPSSGGGTVH